MGKQEELEKLDRVLRDGDVRLRTIKMNTDSLTKEIDTLEKLEIELERNIKCLKKKNIVAMATEYKKAKEDLARTRIRAIALKNDRAQFKKASDEVESAVKKAKEDIEKLKKSGDNNVLRGKFGRKDNG